MIYKLDEAVEGALQGRGLGDVWWGARILEAWPYAVGARYAKKARPILEKSDLHERGLLVVAVKSSSYMHALSFIDIAAHLNHELGNDLIQKVRFELRENLP